jgi:putative membrane protein
METKQTSPLVWLGLAIVLAVGLMAVFAAFFAPYGGGYGMMGGGMGWGVLFMVVPAVFLIVLLLAALGAFPPGRAYVPASPALETLQVRYARGELTHEDYVRMRADLEGQVH